LARRPYSMADAQITVFTVYAKLSAREINGGVAG